MTPTPIKYEHRLAVQRIDSELEMEICGAIINRAAQPAKFASLCFDFLDAIGDEPFNPLQFARYIKDQGFPQTARFYIAGILEHNPGSLSPVLQS